MKPNTICIHQSKLTDSKPKLPIDWLSSNFEPSKQSSEQQDVREIRRDWRSRGRIVGGQLLERLNCDWDYERRWILVGPISRVLELSSQSAHFLFEISVLECVRMICMFYVLSFIRVVLCFLFCICNVLGCNMFGLFYVNLCVCDSFNFIF